MPAGDSSAPGGRKAGERRVQPSPLGGASPGLHEGRACLAAPPALSMPQGCPGSCTLAVASVLGSKHPPVKMPTFTRESHHSPCPGCPGVGNGTDAGRRRHPTGRGPKWAQSLVLKWCLPSLQWGQHPHISHTPAWGFLPRTAIQPTWLLEDF